jgi:hypothetical protein
VTATDPAAGLLSLTSFTVTVHYRRDETTFEVRQPRQRDPVALLRKPGPYSRRVPYQVLTGPGLAEQAGQVSGTGAAAADGSLLGTVTRWGGSRWAGQAYQPVDDVPVGQASTAGSAAASGQGAPAGTGAPAGGDPATGTVRGRQVRVTQPGLPILTGRPSGMLTRLAANPVTDFVLKSDIVPGLDFLDHRAPLAFGFSGRGSAGFTITRRAGRAPYHVHVRDPRIERRLVLACVVSLNSVHAPNLRQYGVDLTTNPFRR